MSDDLTIHGDKKSAGLDMFKSSFSHAKNEFNQTLQKLRFGGYTHSLMPGGKVPTGPDQTAFQS